jgi:uncharacterized repeat protein (TIGR01451 family)
MRKNSFVTLTTVLIILTTLLTPFAALAQNNDKVDPFQATYRVTFTNLWASSTHPTSFPGNAHWSPLVGGVHNANVTFWEPGGIASNGIEQMAETGATSTLQAEINASAHALASYTGSRLPPSSGSDPVLLNETAEISSIVVNKDFPLVTFVTMIAPSPDWFAGVHGQSLLDNEGHWVANKVVTLYPYDAGTDSGSTYTSPNADITPHLPIVSLQGVSPFSTNPVGTLTFTRIDYADLDLSKGISPLTEITPQDTVTYTLVLSNSGDTIATGAALTDTLPAALSFAAWITQPAGAGESNGAITWNGSVMTDTSVTFIYVATYTGPSESGIVTNTARFAHTSSDGTNSGQASASFIVQSSASSASSIYLPLVVKQTPGAKPPG